jgi:hypothetical protein
VNSLTRLIWRFALAHSDESRLKNLVDDDALVGVENDPSSVARFMRSMGSELGEEAGPEFDQTIEEMEHGGATARLRQRPADTHWSTCSAGSRNREPGAARNRRITLCRSTNTDVKAVAGG